MFLGITRPILSLFAQSLGASLTLVGALSLVVGLTQLSLAIVIGTASDRYGRKKILLLGMVCLSLTAGSIALTTQPNWLLPTQIFLGLGFVGTITISIAYMADVVSVEERSLAIGMVATMMGLGYATGAWLGGTTAEYWGYVNTYWLAAAMGVVGASVAWFGLPNHQQTTKTHHTSNNVRFGQQIIAFIQDPMIVAISFGAFLIFLVFGGLVIAFFPIYTYGLGLSQATIGSMLAARALASTLARLPGGALALRIPGHWILLTALLVDMIFAFALPRTESPVFLMGLLIAEGVAYGLYLTIGQTLITTYAAESSRGTALGTYATVTGVGGSIMPFFLGSIADISGLASAYYVTGGLVIVGIVLLAWVSFRHG